VSTKGAPHDGQDTVKTLRTIIPYKRACIRKTTVTPNFLPKIGIVFQGVQRKSDSVLSKTAIFVKKEGRKRKISNESARDSSRRKANV